MASIFDALLDDSEDFSVPEKRAATAAALRKQFNYGTLGQLMGVQPTQQAGSVMQEQSQGSLKLAMQKQQAAKEAASAAARQAIMDQRDLRNFDQRERGIEATRINQASAQDIARQRLGIQQSAADRAGAAAASAADAKQLAADTKARNEREKAISAVAKSKSALDLTNRMLTHPGRAAGTGTSEWRRNVPGSKARDFGSMHDQITNQAFMEAFETLKGGGQITNVEGTKATAALTRLATPYLSEADYETALKEFQEVIQRGYEKALRDAQALGAYQPDAQPQGAPPPAAQPQGAPPPAAQPQGTSAKPYLDAVTGGQ